MEKVITVGLCKGRHPLPIDNYIFNGDLNPVDFKAMDEIAESFVKSHFTHDVEGYFLDNGWYSTSVHHVDEKLVIYVTGLTAALCAVLRVCAEFGIEVTLMHFNRETGDYLPQLALPRSACVW